MSRHLLLALSFGFVCHLAFAEELTFESLDGNADGLITTEEAQADTTVAKAFGELDVNGDGFLSQAEYSVIVMSKGG